MSRTLIAIVFMLVPASIVTSASPRCVVNSRELPKTCETPEIVALRRAAYRGATAAGIADDQFRLAVAIEQAARRCPSGRDDGFYEAYGWYATAGGKNHAEAAYRAALYELNRPEPLGGLAFLNIAASNGHAAAQARLAICHLKGVGVERNISYGAQLLIRSVLLKLGGSQPAG
jgi:TPR repeat protein